MRFHILAEGFDLTPELEKYTAGKIETLAKLLPRGARRNVVASVRFTRSPKRSQSHSTCVLVLTLSNDEEMRAEESTMHMYAALDIAVVHLEQQLRAYKRRPRTRLGRPRVSRNDKTV